MEILDDVIRPAVYPFRAGSVPGKVGHDQPMFTDAVEDNRGKNVLGTEEMFIAGIRCVTDNPNIGQPGLQRTQPLLVTNTEFPEPFRKKLADMVDQYPLRIKNVADQKQNCEDRRCGFFILHGDDGQVRPGS